MKERKKEKKISAKVIFNGETLEVLPFKSGTSKEKNEGLIPRRGITEPYGMNILNFNRYY